MPWVYRLDLALHSQIGVLILALGLVLAILTFSYLALYLRKKRKHSLTFTYELHFEKARELLHGFEIVGVLRENVLGRHLIIKGEKENLCLCTILPPGWMSHETKERFEAFSEGMLGYEGGKGIFSPTYVRAKGDYFIFVQEKVINSERQMLPVSSSLIFDNLLKPSEIEHILLVIARAMTKLHSLRTASYERLYHGLFIPSSLLINLDSSKRVIELMIAHTGFVYSIGPRKFNECILSTMPKNQDRDIWPYVLMFAPEQRDPSRWQEVGVCSDIFMFAALACSIFTCERFISADYIKWEKIPQKWRNFLKDSLENEPSKRPRDLQEVEDFLNDPYFILTNKEPSLLSHPSNRCNQNESNSYTLGELLEHLKTNQRGKGSQLEIKGSDDKYIEKKFDEGKKAMRFAKWGLARQNFEEILQLKPGHIESKAQLAIVCYELGDLQKAEEFYKSTKDFSPQLARVFHQHLAHRL